MTTRQNVTGILVLAMLSANVEAEPTDYVCTSNDGLSHLEVRHLKNQRLDATVHLERDGEEVTFGARLLPNASEGFLYQKREYKLFGFEQGPTRLTVVKRQIIGRGGCGRGGCEGGSSTTAKLDQEGNETEFRCHEEIN